MNSLSVPALANTKLIVLELDGATWDVADPLIAAGSLPNLARIKRDGAWGVLCSQEPLLSPALWTTIYTGKTAAEHGIQSFGTTAQDLRCRRVWDMLDQAGFSVGVLGTMAVWPPRPVTHGFIVPDYATALDSQTYPMRLQGFQRAMQAMRLGRYKTWRLPNLIWQLLRMGVSPRRLVFGGLLVLLDLIDSNPLRAMWRKALVGEAMRADAFFHLYRHYRPQFAALHYHATDTLSHFYWQFFEPDAFKALPSSRDVKRYQAVIPQAYMRADILLGRLFEIMDGDTTLIVLSDHGQAAFREHTSLSFLDLTILTRILGIWQDTIPARFGNQHYLHFQDPDLLMRTEQLLARAFITATRQPAFRRITRTARCLSFELAPEVGDAGKDGHIAFPGHGPLSMRSLQVQEGAPVTAWHTLNGIVGLYGRTVRSGSRLDNATILDVTPTILALFGLPRARDMAGRVWWEALTLEGAQEQIDSYEDETLVQQAGPFALTAKERALLKRQLRDLGYT